VIGYADATSQHRTAVRDVSTENPSRSCPVIERQSTVLAMSAISPSSN